MDVVDDLDEVMGKVSQEEIYEKKLTHRIVHIMLINPKTKEVYFQKRSEKKKFLPGYYCTSAGGHVQSGETYEEAARRELREELGLSVNVEKVAELQFITNGHKRFIELFLAFAEGGLNFTDGEVESGEFLNMEDAKFLINQDEKIHPQLTLCFNWLYENKNNTEKSIVNSPSK